MQLPRLVLLGAPALFVLIIELPSRSSGIYSAGIARSSPACGSCHRNVPGAAPGAAAVRTVLNPASRVLAIGQATTIAVSVSGGITTSTRGGFAAEVSAGTFAAGVNTALAAAGSAITHSNSSTRSWSFGYTAPTTPGLIEMFAIGNAVDGDGNNDGDDMWAFTGFDQTATQSTPVRVFVNATGVTPIGASCVGGFGNVPVLGARQVPTVGNASFAIELHGAAPASVVGFILGVNELPPMDLGFLGVTGCRLVVDPILNFSASTSAGSAQRGEGSAILALPLPSGPGLRNRTVRFQAFFADAGSGRPLPLTFSNGLAVTLQ